MPKNKQQNKRAARKNGGARKMTDIPSNSRLHTYNTVSCRLPNITQEVTLRSQVNSVITATTSLPLANSYNFTLSNAQIGSSIFDRYMIEAVRFSIIPRNNAIGVVPGLTDLYCVIDYDDSSALSSKTQAETYSTCLKLAPGESCERTFSPRIAVAAYNGSFTGYLNQSKQWIDAASTTVQHYGLKIFVPATGVTTTDFQSWDIAIEYFLRFKNTL